MVSFIEIMLESFTQSQKSFNSDKIKKIEMHTIIEDNTGNIWGVTVEILKIERDTANVYRDFW